MPARRSISRPRSDSGTPESDTEAEFAGCQRRTVLSMVVPPAAQGQARNVMHRLVGGIAAAICFAAQPALATIVRPVSLRQMAAESAVIVYARVGAREVRRDPKDGRIVTVSSLEVIEPVKGAKAG